MQLEYKKGFLPDADLAIEQTIESLSKQKLVTKDKLLTSLKEAIKVKTGISDIHFNGRDEDRLFKEYKRMRVGIRQVNLSEAQFQSLVTGGLTRHKTLYVKMQGGMVRDYRNPERCGHLSKGYSDLLIFEGAKTFFVELKTDIGTLEKEQEKRFTQLRQQGFKFTIVLRPEHGPFLKKFGKQCNYQGIAIIRKFNEYGIDLIGTKHVSKSEDHSRIEGYRGREGSN